MGEHGTVEKVRMQTLGSKYRLSSMARRSMITCGKVVEEMRR